MSTLTGTSIGSVRLNQFSIQMLAPVSTLVVSHQATGYTPPSGSAATAATAAVAFGHSRAKPLASAPPTTAA